MKKKRTLENDDEQDSTNEQPSIIKFTVNEISIVTYDVTVADNKAT